MENKYYKLGRTGKGRKIIGWFKEGRKLEEGFEQDRVEIKWIGKDQGKFRSTVERSSEEEEGWNVQSKD